MNASPSPPVISLLGKVAEFTEILDRDPQSKVFVPLADTYRRLGMLDEARDVAERGVKALPRFAPGLVILGRIHLEGKDSDGAKALLEKALALDPASLPALHGLARILLGKGEKGRARELLLEGTRRHPDDPGLGQMLSSLTSHSAAASGSTTATLADTAAEDPIATPTIAEIYLKQGLPQRALKVYRDLLLVNPGDDGLRRKIRELEGTLAAAPSGVAASASVPAAVSSPAAEPPSESPQVRYLQLLDHWLVAVRERKTDVR